MLVPNLIVISYPKPTSGANALTVSLDGKLEDTPRKSNYIMSVFHIMEHRRENLLIEFLDVF
jgi:hypothetical protein